MTDQLMQAVSSYASDIDGLINLIGIFVIFWFVAAEGVFLWLCFKFRARDGQKAQYVSGDLKEEKRWVTIPHLLVLVCDVFVIVGAVQVWVNVKQTLPPADATVRVVAQQWAWVFQTPGADGQLDTDDDIKTVNALHIEVGKTYHYQLESKDVLHDFSVPVFRLKQDAIPGRRIMGWFDTLPNTEGEYDIQCAEMCGIGHGLMPARLHVKTAAQYAAWVDAQPETKLAKERQAQKDKELATR